MLKSKLRSKLKTETGLSEVDNDGDVHFDCNIVEYKTEIITGNDKSKISISVQVNYKNKYDTEHQFKEKKFSKNIEINNSEIRDEEKNINKILDEILNEIFLHSVNSWD